jgi:hypothetical protein
MYQTKIVLATTHRRLVVDVTVTGARASSIFHAVGSPLPLPGSLVTGGQKGKLAVQLRALASIGTPSVWSMAVTPSFGGWGLIDWFRWR